MSNRIEAVSVAYIAFEFDDGRDQGYRNVVFALPESLLWSADGVAKAFRDCRESFLVNPGDSGFNENAWESWHLTGVSDSPNAFLVRPLENSDGRRGSKRP